MNTIETKKIEDNKKSQRLRNPTQPPPSGRLYSLTSPPLGDTHRPTRLEGPPLKTLEDEVKESETSRFHRWLEARKERMNAHPVLRHLYKPLVIGVGAFCFIAGLIMLVTPGPGWLFIFIGLGIWGTEFTWARRANRFMKHVVLTAWYRYRAWRQQRKERKAAR